MSFGLLTEELKYKSLESVIYCPPYKEETPIELIELEEFDLEKAKEGIITSTILLDSGKKYYSIILEILDVLDQNRHEFLLDQQKYISFYWNGILVLLIKLNKQVTHDKQLYIPLQKYELNKEERIADKKINRLVITGVSGSILVAGFFGILTLFKSRNSD